VRCPIFDATQVPSADAKLNLTVYRELTSIVLSDNEGPKFRRFNRNETELLASRGYTGALGLTQTAAPYQAGSQGQRKRSIVGAEGQDPRGPRFITMLSPLRSKTDRSDVTRTGGLLLDRQAFYSFQDASASSVRYGISYGQKTRPGRCPEPEIIALRTLMINQAREVFCLGTLPASLIYVLICADREPIARCPGDFYAASLS
jgi:hypothetical protein